ncbi:SDR family oxidoreductase [Oryzihumus sp.]|jgi:short-subunit dehydrogenase|uniref:SDR family NAD(P)-dependent oxidoreductase n=1 Tax=Oryzihumus sp. TaxID=1968903 RepID=UPI002ED7A660
MATALVTGATAGIGLAFCRELAERGHDLVLVARDRARLENVSDELEAKYQVHCEILAADLSDRLQVQKVADRLGEPGRPVDLLVNNAGFGLSRSFLQGDLTEEERALDVLCRAVMVLSHAAALAMRDRGRGAIINVSSVAGFVAMGSYSAAKAWVTTFSEALANELAGTGVTVTALCPGFTHTEFHQRASLDMSRLPKVMWLEADRLVRDCLDDVKAGKVISVPGPQYKLIAALTRTLPRGLVRRASGGVASRRRHGR